MKLIILAVFTTFFVTSISGECSDKAPDCNLWYQLCDAQPPNPYIQQSCQKTCGYCISTTPQSSCINVGQNCDKLNICNNPIYRGIAWNDCRLYCNLCDSPSPFDSSTSSYNFVTPTSSCFNTASDANCEKWYSFCYDAEYAPLMKKECAKTCDYCS
uniref:ShKT domain-containing protein n=1 Tax=Rhabditophanes sp. KR3021 TaxID=114890 RepID=A0AC35TJ46_9BILA